MLLSSNMKGENAGDSSIYNESIMTCRNSFQNKMYTDDTKFMPQEELM